MKRLFACGLVLTVVFSLLLSCSDENEEPPKASACFDFTPKDDLKAGAKINFTSCSENSSSFTWDFGDGATS